MAKTKMFGGRRYLFRSRHRTRSKANEVAEGIRRSGRAVRVEVKDGMFLVWGTSMFEGV